MTNLTYPLFIFFAENRDLCRPFIVDEKHVGLIPPYVFKYLHEFPSGNYVLAETAHSIFSRAVPWERSDLASEYSVRGFVCLYVCMSVCVWTVRIIRYNIFYFSLMNIIWYNIFSFSLINIIWYNIFSFSLINIIWHNIYSLSLTNII